MKFQPRMNRYKGANVTFDPTTKEAYSYNWWCFVKEVKGRLVFNAHAYSNTTSRHQSDVRSVLAELGLTIDVEVDARCGLQSSGWLDEAIYNVYKKMFQAEVEMGRKGIRPATIEACKGLVADCKRDIEALRGLGAKFGKDKQKALKASLQAKEERRLERARAEHKAQPKRLTEKQLIEADFSIVM